MLVPILILNIQKSGYHLTALTLKNLNSTFEGQKIKFLVAHAPKHCWQLASTEGFDFLAHGLAWRRRVRISTGAIRARAKGFEISVGRGKQPKI